VPGAGDPTLAQQYVFSAPGAAVNLARTLDGSNPLLPVAGQFNIELITSPNGLGYLTPSGYQGVAVLPGGSGQALQLLGGDYRVADIGNGNSIGLGSGNQTVIGAASDTIAGGSGNGWIDGSAGWQQIAGGVGHSTIVGGAGDIIIGSFGAGTSAIIGAAGDAVIGGNGADAIEGGAGWQAITAGAGHNFVVGGAGDVIFGSTGAGNATILGAQGDAVMGGYGADRIDGSAGWQAAGPGQTTVLGGAGDVIFGSTGAGSATIQGAQGDAIMGGAGADRIDGTAGAQPITGGSGSTVVLAGGGDTIYGGSGNLSVAIDHASFAGAVQVGDTGTAGHDTVTGFSQIAGDRLFFAGQSPAAVDQVVAAASISAGNTTLNLPDGSTLTLVGLTHVDSSFFR
jgi:Ca2+-binding RTX toxin-like protein